MLIATRPAGVAGVAAALPSGRAGPPSGGRPRRPHPHRPTIRISARTAIPVASRSPEESPPDLPTRVGKKLEAVHEAGPPVATAGRLAGWRTGTFVSVPD